MHSDTPDEHPPRYENKAPDQKESPVPDLVIELKKYKKKCLAYCRTGESQQLFVYLNFSKDILEIKNPIEKPEFLFSTRFDRKALLEDSSNGMLRLSPFEGVIFK